jgi:tetratricopeptide (TPR) repeat protein
MQLKHFGEALKVCNNLIASGHNHPQVYMIMAIALGQLEKYSESTEIFNKLTQHFPNNPEIYYNFALISSEKGDVVEALELYQKCIKLNPSHFSALNNAGILELKSNNFNSAKSLFLQAIKVNGNNIEYIRNLAQAYYQCNDYNKAENTIRPILSSKQSIAEDYILCLDCHYEKRELIQASILYKQAIKQFPANATLLNIAGLIEIDNKKYNKAYQLLSQTTKIQTNNIEFQINRLTAYCHTQTNSRHCLSRLKELMKHSKTEHLYEYAANLCESLGEIKASKKYIKKGLLLNDNNANLLFINAKLMVQKKKYNQALKLLKIAKTNSHSSKTNYEIYYEEGRVLDRLYNHKKAWKSFTLANKLNAKLTNSTSTELHYLNQAAELKSDFTQYSSAINTNKHNSEHSSLVFIVGFPRSGTTLLERLLLAHPRTQVLEETNAVNELYYEINLLKGTSFFHRLKSLSKNEVTSLQNSYFNSINEYFDWNKTDTIIDKMPMNGNHLALIMKIFPNAKILFALRHPIDVCLSCLMQNMLQVYSFNSAAKVYDSYMETVQLYRTHLSLNILDVKYEDLIKETNTEIKKILNFIELEWHENIEEFYKNKAIVNTPSYQQVNQPIYQEAKYRYKNYLPFINQELAPLQKWLSHFAYTL